LDAELPHSYMAFGPLAVSVMLDHKCVINPYNVYVHSDHWPNEELQEGAREARSEIYGGHERELVELLSKRTYTSGWAI
jgi:hypothetical protein